MAVRHQSLSTLLGGGPSRTPGTSFPTHCHFSGKSKCASCLWCPASGRVCFFLKRNQAVNSYSFPIINWLFISTFSFQNPKWKNAFVLTSEYWRWWGWAFVPSLLVYVRLVVRCSFFVQFIRSGGLKHGTEREPLHRALPGAAFFSRHVGKASVLREHIRCSNYHDWPFQYNIGHQETIHKGKM